MNSQIPFEIEHHARMLSDKVRLNAFKNALQRQVGESDCVVDLGTGTGILASYAALCTKNDVYGIEYFTKTAVIAESLVRQSETHNVKIINAASFYRPIKADPDVLVTETIGPIGPEENIVEMCYEFCKRYPSIQKIIPSCIKIYVQPIYSENVNDDYHALIQKFYDASHKLFNCMNIGDLIELQYCSSPRWTTLQDAFAIDSPELIAEYNLGETKSSDFLFATTLRQAERTNALHVYFEANLGSNICLTSHMSQPLTHWKHCYVRKPSGASRMTITYKSEERAFTFQWRKK